MIKKQKEERKSEKEKEREGKIVRMKYIDRYKERGRESEKQIKKERGAGREINELTLFLPGENPT